MRFWATAIFLAFLAHAAAVADDVQRLSLDEVKGIIYVYPDKITSFSFQGQALSRHDGGLIHLTDGNHCLSLDKPTGQAFTNVTAGDVIDVSMSRDRERYPFFRVRSVRTVGRRPIPEPVEMAGGQIRDPRFLDAFVRTRGVVFSSTPDELDGDWNWTLVKTESGMIAFAAMERLIPLSELRKLTDAEVELQGVVSAFTSLRSPLGTYLALAGPRPLQVLRPAADLDAVPPLGKGESLHRQRTTGTVLSGGKDRFFIARPWRRTMQVRPSAGSVRPQPGDTVTVAGFSALDPLQPQLVEALVRIDAAPGPHADSIKATTLDRLFRGSNGQNIITEEFDRQLVRTRGTVKERLHAAEGGETLVIGDGTHVVGIDISVFPDALPDIVPGSTVDVTGLCVAGFESSTTSAVFPRFRGFTLFPRSPADVVLVARPPWWTVPRLLGLVAVLVLILIAVLIWNRALNALSIRRGRELYREELAHARSDWKVEERTRLSVELHDSVSQTLTGVALQIDAARKCDRSPNRPAARFLDTACAMLASCRQELRCFIWDLRNRTFEEKDMTEAVLRTVTPHLGDVAAQVRFNVPREILSETTVHDILCIVRELVVNAIRHGQARNIRIAGERRDGKVRFSVRDDGCGFDPETAPGPKDGHFGLQGIRERLGAHDGDLTVRSAPGDGSRITVTLADDDREENEQ